MQVVMLSCSSASYGKVDFYTKRFINGACRKLSRILMFFTHFIRCIATFNEHFMEFSRFGNAV